MSILSIYKTQRSSLKVCMHIETLSITLRERPSVKFFDDSSFWQLSVRPQQLTMSKSFRDYVLQSKCLDSFMKLHSRSYHLQRLPSISLICRNWPIGSTNSEITRTYWIPQNRPHSYLVAVRACVRACLIEARRITAVRLSNDATI